MEFRYRAGKDERILVGNVLAMEKKQALIILNDVTEDRLHQQKLYLADRLASVGYGAERPITTNDTEKGRARNRRVVILIVANLQNQHAQADTRNLDLLQQQLRALPTNVN